MRLHKTGSVKIMMSDKVSIIYRDGMIDKNNLLSLVRRDGWWHVSTQRNGMRLDWFSKKKDARAYMEYMLECAPSELASIPVGLADAIEFANSSELRQVHFDARKAALGVALGQGHGNQGV